MLHSEKKEKSFLEFAIQNKFNSINFVTQKELQKKKGKNVFFVCAFLFFKVFFFFSTFQRW